MKGIILAGGSGSRLFPITKGVSKQLLPVYDKPMIYYPLSVLMLAGIKEVLIITTALDQIYFKRLLGDGKHLGMRFTYVTQPKPDGIAQAFIIGEKFIGDDDVCLILGDNIFFGNNFSPILKSGVENVIKKNVATIFGYRVADPERYGIVELDNLGLIKSLVEKPKKPTSNFAVTGLYFYPNDVLKKAKKCKPSKRGELEITSINQMYLEEKRLKLKLLERGYAWLDTGTYDSLLEASSFIETIEKRQGLKIACIEEVAFSMGFINRNQLKKIGQELKDSKYGQYIMNLIK